MPAVSGGLTARTISVLPDENRGGCRNVRLLAIKPPDAAGNPRMFYCIQSP